MGIYTSGAASLLTLNGNQATGFFFSGNQDIDATLIGSKWNILNQTYSFPTNGSVYVGYTSSEPQKFSPFNVQQQQGVQYALGLVSSYTNLTFTQITETASVHATHRFGLTNEAIVGSAQGHFPANTPDSGDVWFNDNTGSKPQPFYLTPALGNWGMATMMHEIGHSLGLKHGHQDYTNANLALDLHVIGVRFGSKALPTNHDGQAWSLMTYQGDPTDVPSSFNGDHFNQPETYMQDDIAALQFLYGANFNTNSSNTTYTWSPTTGQMFINGVGQGAPQGNKIFETIWDGNGVDTYDLSNYNTNLVIDLNPGAFSTFSSAQLADTRSLSQPGQHFAPGNVANALLFQGDTRSLIENAIGGPGNDSITGNAADNTLRGGLGNDTIDGGPGTDGAVFSGLRSAYTLTALSGNSVTVSGPDGTDTVRNVERLVFNDQTVTWPPAGGGGGDDFADSLADVTSPFGVVALNGSTTGNLETLGDRDWFRVQLSPGTYTVDLKGQTGGGGTLLDPYLRVHSSNGSLIAENDDAVPNVNIDSHLTFTATVAGTYYFQAGAFNDSFTGTYKVSLVSGTVAADDFADTFTDNTAPFGQVTVNGSATGILETIGDRDWFRVQLTTGTTYAINLQGQDASQGTLGDPYLRVHASSGALLAEADDIVLGVNHDSQLAFTATATGFFYLEAGAFDDNFTGTYRVGVIAAPTAAADDFADSLTDATAAFGQVAINGLSTGTLEAAGDRDWFRVQLTAGTNYTVNLQGQLGGGGTLEDPFLRVYDSNGNLLTSNDDIVLGVNRDSQVGFLAATSGTYYLEAGAFNDIYTGTYRVGLSATPIPDDFADALVDVSSPFGQVATGNSATGYLETPGDRDWFRAQLTAGTTYTINLQGQGAGGGTLEDPYLRVRSSNGTLLAENDDIVLGVNRDSNLSFTAATTGTFYLEAGAFDDNYSGTYRVTLSRAGVPVTVSAISATTDNNITHTYAGHLVTITVLTSDLVNVTGTPTLQLNDNEVATYAYGSGTSALTFAYMPLPGDNTPDLRVTGLNLPGGATIKGLGGSNLSGPVAADLGIQVDSTTVPATSVQQEILGLYAALYNRAAEGLGFAFWVNFVAQQPDGAGVTVLNAGTAAVTFNDAKLLGQAFVNTQSSYFNQIYGSSTDSQFINALYVNIGGNAGDPGGINFWTDVLHQAELGGQSVQAARAGVVGQFVHDLIDINLATFPGLTPAQLLAATQRQETINNKIAVSLTYETASLQPGGGILTPQTFVDAAFQAATNSIQGLSSDSATVTSAITGIHNAVVHQDLQLI